MSAMVYGESDGQWQPVQRLIIRYFVNEISDGETPVSNWPFGEFIIDKIYVGEMQADEEQYRCLHLRRKLNGLKSVWLNLVFSNKERTGIINTEIRFSYDDWAYVSHLKEGFIVNINIK